MNQKQIEKYVTEYLVDATEVFFCKKLLTTEYTTP